MSELSASSNKSTSEPVRATETADFDDEAGIRRAAQVVAGGQAIGTYLDGVDTIWIDASIPEAAAAIQTIKGEQRAGKPLSTALESQDLVPLLDPVRIPLALHPIFLDPDELSARLGALAPLRLSVRRQAAQNLPPVLVSQSADGAYWLQNWIPNGHRSGTLLVRALKQAGVDLPGGTSMNVSGRPEISDQDEALAFSREHGISLLLRDPHPSRQVEGSFPIIGVGPEGVTLLREGHFPGELFSKLLDYPEIDLTQAKPAKYPISEAVRTRFENTDLRGRELRRALLDLIHGQ